jgi:hypothetical protein
MMELIYGPVVMTCAAKSVAFGLLFALAFPAILTWRTEGRFQPTLVQRMAIGLAATGFFGLGELALFCAADGYPPRIIQSTGVAFAMLALVGVALIARSRKALPSV